MYLIKKICPECSGNCDWQENIKRWVCHRCGLKITQTKMTELVEESLASRKRRAETLPPIPPRPESGGHLSMHNYIEANKEQIIYEAKTTGEKATKERWGLNDSTWLNCKKRWDLPINPHGVTFRSLLA